jgi:uncharacterized protein
MSLSMYQASIPVFVRMLGNLSAILDKGLAHAEQKKFDPTILVSARLAPDMHALARQVQIACDSAKGCAARLAGVDIPSHPDTETSLPELKARIARTIDFLQGLKAEQIDGSEGRTITMKVGPQEMSFKGQQFLLGFAMPNFYFHVTTAYALLRHNGVNLGKGDFIGSMQ